MTDQGLRGMLRTALAVALIFVSGPLASAATGARDLYTPAELAAIYRHSPPGPVPADPTDGVADDPGAARLGQFLFFDTRLSANGKIACATCHQPARAFTDARTLTKGIAVGTRNAPTVLDAAYNHWFFLDGRADSLWSQALQPFENPREMGTDRLHVLHVLAADAVLRAAYERIFGVLPPLSDRRRFPAHARPGPAPHAAAERAWRAMAPADRNAVNLAFSNLGKAIEAYERKLVSRRSPFDRYVKALRRGDPAAQEVISPAARRGLKLFVGVANCDLCHSGPMFTDGQFHNLGLPVLPGERPDSGRAEGIRLVRADIFNGAGAFSDDRGGAAKRKLAFLPSPKSQLGAFKTPSLRDVALTAPYMHDGRFATLQDVMRFYAQGKAVSRGRLVGTREVTVNLVPRLTPAQQRDLSAFLKTLTGEPLPGALTAAPARP